MKNSKGFTLVELLAVIIVLTVVILIALRAVIPQMEKGRRKAFTDEANTIGKAAINKYTADLQREDGSDDLFNGEEVNSVCYDFDTLKDTYIKKYDDSYKGSIEVCTSGKCGYMTKLWLTNGEYYISGSIDPITTFDISLTKINISNCGR